MLYIIPALGDTGKEDCYNQIATDYKILNLQVKKNKKFSLLIEKAIKVLKPNDVVFGFSMGALIAYCATTIVPVKKAIFASISPYLENDYLVIREPYPIKFDREFGKIFINDIKNKAYLPSKAKELYILYGQEEHVLVLRRSRNLSKLNQCRLIEIPKTGHELTERYIKQIKKLI